MKFNYLSIFLISIFAVACGQNGNQLGPLEFHDGVTSQEDIIILDVRTPDEFAMNHIKGAQNINIYDPLFNEEINNLDNSKTVYVYCKSGGRSSDASKQLSKSGFKNVNNLDGGLMAWDRAGMPLESNTVKKKAAAQYTLDEYNTLVDGNSLVLFDFMADWCGPCKFMAPGLKKIEDEYSSKLKVVKVNVDFNQQLSEHFQISSIPALKIYHNGKLVEDVVGARDEMQLRNMLSSYL